MLYDFANLSDGDFEVLARDLVGRALGVRFEAFGRGRDGGIDGRADNGAIVLQAKHYLRSEFSKLKATMKTERAKIDKLSPRRYILATSASLTPANKQALVTLIGPSLQSTADIFGPDDLNALLRENPDLVKANPNLWGQTAPVLEVMIDTLLSQQFRRAEGRLRDALGALLEMAVIGNAIPFQTIQDILEREGFTVGTPAAAIKEISRIVAEIKQLRGRAAHIDSNGDPSVVAAADVRLARGDLEGYAKSLTELLTRKKAEQEEATVQQYQLIALLADTQTIQGKFDHAISMLEEGIALFQHRTDKPAEPFMARWRIALILGEKGRRLHDRAALHQAIVIFDELEKNTYVKALEFLRGRIIVNRFTMTKKLLLMDLKYDDVANMVTDLQPAMDAALKGVNEDVRQTRNVIWQEIFEAGHYTDNDQLLRRALGLATYIHGRHGYPVRLSRKERSRGDPENFNIFVETSSRLIRNLSALYRVNQTSYAGLALRSAVLAERTVAKVRKFGLGKIYAQKLCSLAASLSDCARICQRPALAKAALQLLSDYHPDIQDQDYFRGLPQLEATKAEITLENWWVLSNLHDTSEIAVAETTYRFAIPWADQLAMSTLLEYCGDAYRQVAIISGRSTNLEAFDCYQRAYQLAELIFQVSPAYPSRLRARVWNKALTLAPELYITDAAVSMAPSPNIA